MNDIPQRITLDIKHDERNVHYYKMKFRGYISKYINEF